MRFSAFQTCTHDSVQGRGPLAEFPCLLKRRAALKASGYTPADADWRSVTFKSHRRHVGRWTRSLNHSNLPSPLETIQFLRSTKSPGRDNHRADTSLSSPRSIRLPMTTFSFRLIPILIPIALCHAPISRPNIKVGATRMRTTDTRHLSIDTGRRKTGQNVGAKVEPPTSFCIVTEQKFLSTVLDGQLSRFGSL